VDLPQSLFPLAFINAKGVPARGAEHRSFFAQASEHFFPILPSVAAEAAAVARADLLLRVKQDDVSARWIQFSDLLVEAENDFIPIGNELAAQAIHIRFAGLALIGRSLLLGYGGDREEEQKYEGQVRQVFHWRS
jgi:hypothetical protein